ncbi:hypothetical protein C8J57DRAFT_1227972 [Mycena rebaudengoi]|nr:hypothetical protein C8J57DRAFT_1227972 [Mycena rebaudengoi]
MAPGQWATPAQSLHLRADLSKYCKFADMGKFERFWAEMENAWFAKWLEDALKLPCVNTPKGRQLTGAELVIIGTATKKRVKMRAVSRKIDPASMGALLFRKKAKCSRKLWAIEVYQKRTRSESHAACAQRGTIVSTRRAWQRRGGVWVEYETPGAVVQRMKETNTKCMKMRREVVAEMWGAETEAQKQFYRDAAAKQRKKGGEEAAVGEGDDDDVCRRPEELQASIQELEGVLKIVHDTIEQKTGWKGMTVVGGPMPEKGGKLVVEAYCFGVSAVGCNLSQGHVQWTEVVHTARSERVKWALTMQENDLGDIDTGGNSGSGSDSDTGGTSDSDSEAGEEEDLFGDRLLAEDVGNRTLEVSMQPAYSAAQLQAQSQPPSSSSHSATMTLGLPTGDISQAGGRLTGSPYFDFQAAPYSFDDESFGGDGRLSSFDFSYDLPNGTASEALSGLLGLSAAFSNSSALSERSLGGFEEEFGNLGGAESAPGSTPSAQPFAVANGLDLPTLGVQRLLAEAEAKGVEAGAIPTFHDSGRSAWAATSWATPGGGAELRCEAQDELGGGSRISSFGLWGGHQAGETRGRDAKLLEDVGTMPDGGRGQVLAPAPVLRLPAPHVGLEDALRKAARAEDAAAFDEAWRLTLRDGAEEGSAGGRGPPQSRLLCNLPKAVKPVKKKAGKAVGGKKAARGGKKKATQVGAEEGGGRSEGKEKSAEPSVSGSGSGGEAREERDGQEVVLTAAERRKVSMAKKRGEKEEAGIEAVERQTGVTATGEEGAGEEGGG